MTPAALAFAVLFGVSGCGTQDRYEVTLPRHEPMETLDGGVFEPVPVLLAGLRIGFVAGWSADDFLIGGNNGRVVRFSGGRARQFDLPVDGDLVELICLADGGAYAATEDGYVANRTGDTWETELVEAGARVQGLALDEQGRSLICTSYPQGRLWRRDPAGWTELLAFEDEAFLSVWWHPARGAAFVTSRGRLVEVRNGEIVTTLLGESPAGYYFARVAGDGAGRMAVRLGDTELWLKDGETWNRHASTTFGLTQLYWQDDGLRALSGSSILGWNGFDWETLDTLDIPGSLVNMDLANGLGLFCSEFGEVLVEAGGEWTTAAPPQGHLRGMARHDGAWYALFSSGAIWTGTGVAGGVWQPGVRTAGSTFVDNSYNNLLTDDLGRLVAIGKESQLVFEAGAWREFAALNQVSWAGRQADGEILALSRDAVLSLRAGVATLEPLPAELSQLRSAFRSGPSELTVIIDQTVSRVTPDGRHDLWTAVGWSLRGLLSLGPDDFMVFGLGGIRRQTGAVVSDVTPFVYGGSRVDAGRVCALHALADGRLVAWDNSEREFFVCRDEVWYLLDFGDGDRPDSRQEWYLPHFVPDDDALMVFGNMAAGRLHLPGSP